MADHSANSEPPVTAVEPASITEIARLIVAALVTLGVFEFDDTTWNTITLIIGGIISIVLTWWARRKVTPTAKPRSNQGAPLVPATPPTAPPSPPTTGGPPPPTTGGPAPPTTA